ncbi:Uncharacterized protein PBTT_05528 [Plasmodiophora brassicae]|uniref:Uncharacterized protein n=1 Tax=Plasmodiophora brassicae TaxID=37360 RepID=A0A0G4IQD5_PLABS|nr:hypothetical protein PBRA_000704 [Plasmodiophora brassicae]SPQ97669.1 unnamed protein product [Plasmodiophora brassicae]
MDFRCLSYIILDARQGLAKLLRTGVSPGLEPSWFVDQISVDDLLAGVDSGKNHFKLWRDTRIIGEAFLKRSSMVAMVQDLRKFNQNGPNADPQLTSSSTALPLYSPEDETVTIGQMKLEISRLNRVYTLFEHLSTGMKFDITLAIDMHVSNGDPTDIKSLHYDDPKSVSDNAYLARIRPILELLLPYARTVKPVAFVRISAVSRMQPADRHDRRDALHEHSPCELQRLSRPLAATDMHYSVVIIVSNDIPDDMPAIREL